MRWHTRRAGDSRRDALLDRDELVGDEIAAVIDEAAAMSERVIDFRDHPLRRR